MENRTAFAYLMPGSAIPMPGLEELILMLQDIEARVIRRLKKNYDEEETTSSVPVKEGKEDEGEEVGSESCSNSICSHATVGHC